MHAFAFVRAFIMWYMHVHRTIITQARPIMPETRLASSFPDLGWFGRRCPALGPARVPAQEKAQRSAGTGLADRDGPAHRPRVTRRRTPDHDPQIITSGGSLNRKPTF